MVPSLALLPSPLLGPSAWQPVADVLADRGWHAAVCSPPTPVRTPREVLDAFHAALAKDRDIVLVPHSNAGAYVPALLTQHGVVASVFVDAMLPPVDGHISLAPPALLDLLREKADGDGMLPVWTDWWTEADMAGIFPDPQTRRRVEREQQRLPLSYFEETLPVPPGWDEHPAAYLAFGETYAAERHEAVRRQMPVTTLRGGHLHLLHDPGEVATALIALISRLGFSAT